MLSKVERNIIAYIVASISEFADHYSLNLKESYIYLRNYQGINFLIEFYDVEHTLSFEDAVDDLNAVCVQNGGSIL